MSTGLEFAKVYLVKLPKNPRSRGRDPQITFDFLNCFAQNVLGDFKSISVANLQTELEQGGKGDSLVAQLGLLSPTLYDSEFSLEKFFDEVLVISGMADLMLSIDNNLRNNFRPIEFLESRHWRNNLKDLNFNAVYFPKLFRDDLSILGRPIVQIDKGIARKQIEFALSMKILSPWFKKLYEIPKKIIIINPYQVVTTRFAKKVSKIVRELEGLESIAILIKPHPSSLNPDTICAHIDDHLPIKSINATLGINGKEVSGIPLELFFTLPSFRSVIGSPSSAFFLLNHDQIKLVKQRSGYTKRDMLERANAGPFLRLCVSSDRIRYH